MFRHAFFSKVALAVVTAGTLVVSTLPAQAGEVGRRIHHETARIDQGVASGALTDKEYLKVDKGLDRIQAQRRADLKANDGHLTSSEYQQLNKELNRESDQIYFYKHNQAHQ